MSIKTISIVQENYLASQGRAMSNADVNMSDLSLADFSTRSRRSGHLISVPTIPTPPDHIPSPTFIFSDSSMSEGCIAGMTGANNESANADTAEVFFFDVMEGDQQHSSLDSPLSSMKVDPPMRIESSRHQHGLGISGLLSKDGNGPFTGLGLFSVRPSPWRNLSSSGDSQSNYSNKHRCDTNQVQTQTLPSFLDHNPESPNMSHTATAKPYKQSQKFSRSHLCHRTLTPPQLVKHFSAPTVLNDHKEMSPQLNEHCRRRLGRSAYILRRAPPCPMMPRKDTGISSPALRRCSDTYSRVTGDVSHY